MNAPREQRSLYRFNGKEAVELAIIQQPEASAVRVIADVKAKLKELQEDFPGLKFEVAYDNATFVGYLMDNMVEELVLAIGLTGLVVLLFLGNLRGTLISVITIPISLAMALLAMVPFGMTLNSSTLIGLLLSIGRLVDDSIIDIHSIERHLRMGKSPKDAAVDGISEVRLAVLAITFMVCVALSAAGLLGRDRPVHVRGHRLADHLRPAGLGARLLHPDRAAGRQPVQDRTRRRRPPGGRGWSDMSWIRASGSSSGWKPGTAAPWAGPSGTASSVLAARDSPSSSSASPSTPRSAAR